jgi:ATP-dependent DNA helicase 2 subunit 2
MLRNEALMPHIFQPKSERFWRKFVQRLAELTVDDDVSKQPAIGSIELALSIARGPSINQPDSTPIKSVFRIGSKAINTDEGIEFPVRYSKATAKAMPMSLKKVIANELLPQNQHHASSYGAGPSQSQSQAKSQGRNVPQTANVGIEADVTPFKKYTVMVPKTKDDTDTMDVDDQPVGSSKPVGAEDDQDQPEIEYEEREVEEDNLVKAYKFGKTWVPMPKDIFPDMETVSGMDLLGFMKSSGVSPFVSRSDRNPH